MADLLLLSPYSRRGVDLPVDMGRSTKFSVTVFKASMLVCMGVDLPADLG